MSANTPTEAPHPRAALHSALIERILGAARPATGVPRATILAGGLASGKSTAVRLLLQLDAHCVRISADEARTLLPEFEGLADKSACGPLDSEASLLARTALAAAIARKLDVIYDTTLGGPVEYRAALLQRLRTEGYRVTIVGLDVNEDTAILRAAERATQSLMEADLGRNVEEKLLRRTHREAARNILMVGEWADEVRMFDNEQEVPRLFYRRVGEAWVEVYDENRYEAFCNKAGRALPFGQRHSLRGQRRSRLFGDPELAAASSGRSPTGARSPAAAAENFVLDSRSACLNGGGAAPITVVIAGGGTGGHLIPGLAVAGELCEMGAERVLFVGTERGIEARMVPQAGFELECIQIGGLNRSSLRRQLSTLLDLAPAILASRRILRRSEATVVLGIGGYASGPVLAAAGMLGVAVVVLEVNAKTGLANRLAARWVHTAAVNFPQTAADFPRSQTMVTGIPVRPEFFGVAPRPENVPFSVLIFGGSQGAARLNRVAAEWAASADCAVMHQTGKADFEAVCQTYARAGGGDRVRVAPFIDDMAAAMGAADVVVCRSGASTLGELAAARRAAILVPFPGAADDHQLRNAQAYADAGAAILIEQVSLDAATLGGHLAALRAEPRRRGKMAAAAGGFAHPRAAAEIAAAVLRASQEKRG